MSVNEVKIKRADKEFEIRGTGPPTSRTFVLGNEDHTIGNALRHVLINDARIDFAGYCVPHPSEPAVHIRVQSNEHALKSNNVDEMVDDNDDGEPLTAIEALTSAALTLSKQCDLVLKALEVAAPEVKEDRERMERMQEEENRKAAEEERETEGVEEG